MNSMLKYATQVSGSVGQDRWNHAGDSAARRLALSRAEISLRRDGSASSRSSLSRETVCRTTQGFRVSSQSSGSNSRHSSSPAWFHDERISRASSAREPKPLTFVGRRLYIGWLTRACLLIAPPTSATLTISRKRPRPATPPQIAVRPCGRLPGGGRGPRWRAAPGLRLDAGPVVTPSSRARTGRNAPRATWRRSPRSVATAAPRGGLAGYARSRRSRPP